MGLAGVGEEEFQCSPAHLVIILDSRQEPGERLDIAFQHTR
jgi:hypothetical protein